jgi:hypothetical protein
LTEGLIFAPPLEWELSVDANIGAVLGRLHGGTGPNPVALPAAGAEPGQA